MAAAPIPAAASTAASNSNITESASSSSMDTSIHPCITRKLVDTGKYYCPFLDRGFCRESASCSFSHADHESIRIPTEFCHFYLANRCLYGQDCKFIHGEPLAHTLETDVMGAANINLTETAHIDGDDPDEPHHYQQQISNSHPHMVNDKYINLSRVLKDSPTSSSTCHTDSVSTNQELSGNQDVKTHQTTLPPKPVWQTGRLLASLKGESSSNRAEPQAQLKDLPLCPYAVASGGCPYPDGVCSYLHGQVCDLCCMPCLHPYDEAQKRQHRDDCLREHEREMELSFAVQRSKDKICGICMETVVEKKPVTSSRFGVLEQCNHIFCLDCIRKWRGTKQSDMKTIRACPECRVNSDFVVPSKYWIEDQDDKEKLIRDYKAALRSKPCRYFNEGKGDCPFAGSCFYKHAYPDGRLAEEETPKPKRRVYGAQGSTSLTRYVLWSLIRSFDDGDWSNDDDSDRFYIDYDDEDDVEDNDTNDEDHDRVNNDDDDDDEVDEISAGVAGLTASVW